MTQSQPYKLKIIELSPFFFILILTWTAFVAGSLIWNMTQVKDTSIELARIQARAFFNKDVIYRKWNAMHGGVYVAPDETTPPNPYLKVGHRDVVTRSGQKLTLINPAYMTRQVHELAAKSEGVKGHITSLNPIRPENKADAWETTALKSFETGAKEISAIEDINNQSHLRLMQPLITGNGCLKCHAEQGYKQGDIRGGISVSIPLAPFSEVTRTHYKSLIIGHAFLWLFGLTGLILSMRRLKQRITHEHTIAQKALTESEKNYRFLADHSADIIYKADIETERFNYASPSIEILTGYTQEEVLSMKASDINTESSYQLQRERLGNALATGLTGPEIMELEILHKDGHVVPVEIHATILFDEHQKPFEILGTVRDITERKLAADQLKSSEERFRFLAENMADIVFTMDLNLDITYTSAAVEDILGYTVEENKKRKLEDRYTPASLKYIHEILKKELGRDRDPGVDPNRSILLETETYHKNGNIIWMENIIKAIRNEQGDIVGIYGAGRDITRRKKTLETLVQQKKALEQALSEIKQLSGLLPICSVCKKIRDDSGYWNKIESYIQTHSKAQFSHGLCPNCSDELYGKEQWYIDMQNKPEE